MSNNNTYKVSDQKDIKEVIELLNKRTKYIEYKTPEDVKTYDTLTKEINNLIEPLNINIGGGTL